MIATPPLHRPLAEALVRCRERAAGWEPTYDAFVARLRALEIGGSAPRTGEPFPLFALPDTSGRRRLVADLIEDGPLILSFNRGGWCPYCRTELSVWAEALPALDAAGGRFVMVSGEVGGRAERLRDEVGLSADVLCDVDHGLALELGLAFYIGPELRARYLECGLDLGEVYGSPSWFLPIPATFVIDRDAIVRFAFVDPDFRARAEPADVIEVVRGLTTIPVR